MKILAIALVLLVGPLTASVATFVNAVNDTIAINERAEHAASKRSVAIQKQAELKAANPCGTQAIYCRATGKITF